MNKKEITRTINNLSKLKSEIITESLKLNKHVEVGTQSQYIQNQLKDIEFYLKKLKVQE